MYIMRSSGEDPRRQPPPVRPRRKIRRLAKRRGLAYSFLFVRPDGAQLTEIAALLESGRIRPVIDRVFPFDQAHAALVHLGKGRARGKVVVQVKPD